MAAAKVDWDAGGVLKKIKVGRAIIGITAGAILVAGAADAVMNAGEKRKVKKQQQMLKRNRHRKDNYSNQYNYTGTGYIPDTTGLVQSMFNERTGHYKMGNARF